MRPLGEARRLRRPIPRSAFVKDCIEDAEGQLTRAWIGVLTSPPPRTSRTTQGMRQPRAIKPCAAVRDKATSLLSPPWEPDYVLPWEPSCVPNGRSSKRRSPAERGSCVASRTVKLRLAGRDRRCDS